VRWTPAIVSVALAVATLVVIRLAERPLRSDAQIIVLTMVVIGGLCGLADPGRDFVHAQPVSAAKRLAHRLAVIVPPIALAILVVQWMKGVLFADAAPGPGWGALAAFGAAGVALCATLTRRIGARAGDAAVAAMLAWLAAGLMLGKLEAPLGLALPWLRWPALVLIVATVATVVATTRGAEA
jgi:hypothetical protein